LYFYGIGIFVRPHQVCGLDDETAGDGVLSQPGGSPEKDKSPSQESKIAVLTAKKGGIPTPSLVPKSRFENGQNFESFVSPQDEWNY